MSKLMAKIKGWAIIDVRFNTLKFYDKDFKLVTHDGVAIEREMPSRKLKIIEFEETE